jgi:hypothetical protein
MATLKNLTVNDNGFFRLPQGTSGNRPTVPTITVNSGLTGGLTIARDGIQLYNTFGAGGVWQTYQGLPDYLKGLQCTRSVNDGAGSYTFSHATRVYQMRNTTWSNGQGTFANTVVASGKDYISTYTDIGVFYADYAAGTYTINNSSAMYFFSPLAGGTSLAIGSMRFNTTNNVTEIWNGGEWVTVNGAVTNATGGTITGILNSGGYRIHTFTSSGTFTPTYSGPVEVLVVAGGGGGAGLSGGGGAGGVLYTGSFNVVGGLGYPITVGTGGSGATTHSPGGNVTGGNPSIFGVGPTATSIVATGGGHGGHWTGAAGNGGSGGGGPGYNYSNGIRYGGRGTVGQGHPGGWGHHGSGPANNQSSYPQPGICVYGGGGGGGAGERGYDRKSYSWEGRGGDGLASTITGTSQTYYGAGGGSGTHGPAGNYGRDLNVGGKGGGGRSYSGGPQASLDATGHGSGGGGAWHPDTYRSGNGSNGIVIVRYRT